MKSSTHGAECPLLLRVKRPFSSTPVELFNAHPSKRHRLSNADAYKNTCFSYLGTTASLDSFNVEKLDNLEEMSASGARRLFWASSTTAHVFDPVEKIQIAYEVKFSGGKRKLAPADRSEVESVITETNSDSQPPMKSLRIIDLCDSSVVPDPLAMTMNGLRLMSSPVVNEPYDTTPFPSDLNFVYDVYRAVPYRKRKRSLDHSLNSSEVSICASRTCVDENASSPARSDLYFDVSDDARDLADDDSDSNSESNWRNDYPEESDGSLQSETDSSVDHSGRGSSSGSEDDDYCGEYRSSCMRHPADSYSTMFI